MQLIRITFRSGNCDVSVIVRSLFNHLIMTSQTEIVPSSSGKSDSLQERALPDIREFPNQTVHLSLSTPNEIFRKMKIVSHAF